MFHVAVQLLISRSSDTWDNSVEDRLAHTHMHHCSLHLRASFALQLVTPRYVQILLQSEGWDVIKSWQQIIWCVRCAFTSGIWIAQHGLQEREEASTRKVSGCKITWRKEKENAIIMMQMCTFLPDVYISIRCFLLPSHKTDSQFHWGSFTPPWLHYLPNPTRSASSTLTKLWKAIY